MPSLYEPCGLNQLYSLAYGTVPIVRATGGLADTVVDATPEALADGTATGFAFREATPAALRGRHRPGPGPLARPRGLVEAGAGRDDAPTGRGTAAPGPTPTCTRRSIAAAHSRAAG